MHERQQYESRTAASDRLINGSNGPTDEFAENGGNCKIRLMLTTRGTQPLVGWSRVTDSGHTDALEAMPFHLVSDWWPH